MNRARIYFTVVIFMSLVSFYDMSQGSARELGISAKTKGTINVSIQIENAKGEIKFSLLTLTGDKLYEKKLMLPKQGEFVFSGCKPDSVYVIEAEGDLTIEGEGDPVAKHYSRAMKVTTDDRGSAEISFGN